MSKKQILGFILITILAIVGVVGAIGYTFRDSEVKIGSSTLDDNIVQEGTIADPTYSGFVEVEQVIYIHNSGQLDIEDIVVDIQVFFSGELNPTEVEIGQGINELGDIASQANVSKTISITLTERIPRLAVEDGTLRIVIDTTLSLQYIPYSLDIPTQETTESWNAPFNPL